jgi:hypothetical protein
MDDIKTLVAGILENSEFLNAVRLLKQEKAKSRLFGDAVRHLSENEVARLKTQGNKSSDWNAILVSEGFRPDWIADTMFLGPCVLGAFDGRPVTTDTSLSLPSGIYKSTIADSEIAGSSLVSGSTVARYVVCEGAVVYCVGSLACSGKCSFGNGRDIPVGIETGGREILSFADITIPIAQAVATRRNDNQLQSGYRDFVNAYVDACTSVVGIVNEQGIVRHTARVEDTYVGPGGVIDGATLVQNCTMLCTPEEKAVISHGAIARNSCMQWGCDITSLAIVDDSVLIEHSCVERHGKVRQSIIGPNTIIAEGEVTACLVGPFVGFHHQALLIAALWPEGMGNVACGANVGSNHTSKAPDQELWCGEGTFFGLGANVKYPADFTRAPYSVIATGVTTPPQRVEFPFSLINIPSMRPNEVPAFFNEIFPGWVLSNNIYAVKRNESKFLKRNKAKRSAFAFDALRPDTVDMVVTARNRLSDITTKRERYLDTDIPGLGKNVITEESRAKGLAAYNFYIEYYCLCGLYRRLAAGAPASTVYSDAANDAAGEHQRTLLVKEGLAGRSVSENLKRLVAMHEKVAADTQKAKEKDDGRGRAIIDDYGAAHTPAAADPFVRETIEKTKKLKSEIGQMIARL